MTATTTTDLLVAMRVTLTGHVQGIGMRPAIVRFAERLKLTGYVGNTIEGVTIHVEGPQPVVDQFVRELGEYVPSVAELVSVKSGCVVPEGFKTFVVKQMLGLAEHVALSARIPVDLVACEKCCNEVVDIADHRHDYPFTSCTDCGPRYSIIQSMPFEREQTSMTEFPLCDRCQREYDSPSDRRFHAQTNSCRECGPRLWVRDAQDHIISRDQDAVRFAASAILAGRIVALRGVGGYQLLVDATSEVAVQRLRQRKGRAGKPLAVMVASLDEAETFSSLNDSERRLLSSPAGPIVIVNSLRDAGIASTVTFSIGTIGIMFPTSPLHRLLLSSAKRPLVCTSGNYEGEPLVYEQQDALEKLRSIADVWLEHDRLIRRPIDDSVVRVIAGRDVTLRLARSIAPLSLDFAIDEPLIAVGGHQKNSIAINNGSQAILGPHVGDQDTVAARDRFVRHVDELAALFRTPDYGIVGDLHPDYFTTQWSNAQPRPFFQVQHHHAHIVAGMLQHGWLDRQVLGVAFDGTGYGIDGTIWGGEFLLCTATDFQRVGHLLPFSLPGGERSVREPWRVATTLVRAALGDEQALKLDFRSGDANSLISVLKRSKLSPITSSVGRLFDGVAALTLGIERSEFEGQAAILLEAACDRLAVGQYAIPIISGRPQVLDWRPMIRQLIRDRMAGVAVGAMAMRFHRALANSIVEFYRDFSTVPIVLGGGVFQNRVLVELVADQLTSQAIGLPGIIPPNDGGLAAGQLAIAGALAQQKRTRSCV